MKTIQVVLDYASQLLTQQEIEKVNIIFLKHLMYLLTTLLYGRISMRIDLPN
jgi:hypothetical protein